MRDVSAIGEALVTTVKGYVAPIADRLSALEKSIEKIPSGPPGPAGENGVPGAPGRDAEPIDYSIVEAMVSKAAGSISAPQGPAGPVGETGPAGRDAEPVDYSVIESFVSRAVSGISLPPGEPGPKGEPGPVGPAGPPGQSVSLADIASLVQAEVAKAMSMIPAPRDGRDGMPGANGQPGRDGVDGQKGADGRDGFGLEDLDISLAEDGRTVSIKFVRGDLVKEKSFKLATVLDRGVYRPENVYEKGDGCTWGGSYWIAQKENVSGKPGESDDWRLAVKKGRDGRDGEKGKDYESTRSKA